MIHVRVVSPSDVTERLLPVLLAEPGVLNLAVARASVRNPDGDAIQFDVVQATANPVLAQLRRFGVDQRGSISIESVDTSISAAETASVSGRSRFSEYAPVWEEVEFRIRSDARFPPSWYGLLVIAGLIASVGLVTNSQILIVGAMVVGPEYAAIVALAFGWLRHERALVTGSARALVLGFGLAIIGSLVLGLILRAAGLLPRAFALGVRPVSHLINTPDWLSFIVAFLAGLVGVISLTEARASTLIGVFISVTTIPAAADIGVSIATGSGSESLGSFEQLLLNVTVLALVAVLGIPAQRRIWRHISRTTGSGEH